MIFLHSFFVITFWVLVLLTLGEGLEAADVEELDEDKLPVDFTDCGW